MTARQASTSMYENFDYETNQLLSIMPSVMKPTKKQQRETQNLGWAGSSQGGWVWPFRWACSVVADTWRERQIDVSHHKEDS
jgi:hypothetical protein